MLSFAGIPLLLHDPEGAANEYVRKHLDERIASIFTPELIWQNDGRAAPRTNNPQTSIQQVGLPVPTYPQQPRPRINTLYWPTGATRWSQGLFLIDGYNLAAILDTMTTSGGLAANIPQPFIMTTPESGDEGVDALMYLLPPRPVSPPNVDENSRLWILPLVDERYFWQSIPVPDIDVSSWDGVFEAIATALNVELYVDDISPAYGIPDPVEWARKWENAAMLLDAAATTIGKRFVADWSAIGAFDETTAYQVLSYESSETNYADNLTLQGDEGIGIVAGGFFSLFAKASVTPGQVLVTFRNDQQTTIANTIEINGPTGPCDPSQTKVFHTTITDNYRVVAESSQALADQIADDCYGWLSLRYDFDLAGIVGWHSTGFDDFVLWEYGVKKGRKKVYQAQTRVQSLPYNFGYSLVPVQPLPTSSSSSSSSSGSGSGSTSSTTSTSQPCGCVQAVTGVLCVGGQIQQGSAWVQRCCE